MNFTKLSSLRGPNPLAHNSALAVAPSRRSHRLCAAKRDTLTVLVDVDAVVQGLAALSTAWAFSAASATTDIAGTPGVYTSYMQQLMPVVHQPYETALLLRLLHDEGIVGARSTAGREGPVVGRPVRRSGSRPLLLNEILEHWADEIKPTCLLRWSRQAGCSSTQLEQQVQQAYEQAQHSVEWEVLDMQQQQHGSSQSSSSGGGSSQTIQRHAAAAVAAAEPPLARNPATAGAAVSTAAVQCAADPLLGAISPDAASVSVTAQPYVSIVPCLQHCPAQVYVASTYPLAVTQAVLSAVQLQGVQVLCGSSMQHCLQQLPQQPPLQQQLPPGTAASGPSNRQLVVVLSSPSKAPEEQSLLQLAARQQQQQPPLLEPHAPFQVAEWACKAPSLRAKALSGQGLGLLSEWGLAELLGADSSDAVMDGIAWRS